MRDDELDIYELDDLDEADGKSAETARGGGPYADAADDTRRGSRDNGAEFSAHRPRRRTGDYVLYGVMAALLVVVLVAGTFVALDLWEYHSAKSEYAALDQYMDEAIPQTPETEAPQAESPYPPLDIDYKTLKEINPDFVGVLYIPVLSLRYPVVTSHDDTEYLTRTFEGKENSSGCIFLDQFTSADLTDANSFVFGHNMRNGTMFGGLKRFYQEEGLCARDPYIYLYTESGVYKYEIFSYYLTDMYSDAYQDFGGEDGYTDYVNRAISRSAYRPAQAIDYSEQPPLLTLSTCAGSSGSSERFLVHGALAEKYEPNL